MNKYFLFSILAIAVLFSSCKNGKDETSEPEETNNTMVADGIDIETRVNQYAEVRLTSDLSGLSDNQKKIIPLLIEVANITDDLFWYQAFGGRDTLMPALDEMSAEYVKLNYGPWDRLNNMEPFIDGYGPKPEAANFYPADMTKEEFDKANLENKESLYTFI